MFIVAQETNCVSPRVLCFVLLGFLFSWTLFLCFSSIGAYRTFLLYQGKFLRLRAILPSRQPSGGHMTVVTRGASLRGQRGRAMSHMHNVPMLCTQQQDVRGGAKCGGSMVSMASCHYQWQGAPLTLLPHTFCTLPLSFCTWLHA